MRARFPLLILCLVAITFQGQAQAPAMVNYQAVARDAEGNLLSGASLTVRIGILKDQQVVWQEDHDVMTSSTGHFDLMIGDPSATPSGGSLNSFAEVGWGSSTYYLKVQVDAGNGYVDMGAMQFVSVPYALHAANGPVGPPGPEGPVGPQGPQGPAGDQPMHEWSGTSLRFENPDGTWGMFTNLQGEPGEPAADDQVLSVTGTSLSISGGNTVDLSPIQDGVDDADNDPSNELNTNFYLSGSTLYLRDAGGTRSADLSSLGGGSGLWVAEDRYLYPADDRMYVSIGKPAADAKFAISADEDTPDEMPIFEMKNNLGEPIFSGFNNGVMFHIENTLDGKGVKGGFAVGGYQRTKADGVQEFFRVTNDSVRVLINDKPGKGVKGGFAVGGYQRGKAEQSTHFVVLPSQVTVNGNLEVTGDIVQKSDSRLKDDVSEIDHAVDRLQQLRGVYFQWNQEAKDQF